ncbi:MAG: rRNA (guanine2445-N2)-methyltransferase [Pseudomonadota bacterium]|nr:rRNA (guanine2445-N2)-methyltransferase [Pseudomonadota bacterium]
MQQQVILSCFASTNKGLEQILINELEILGANNLVSVNAGVKFTANIDTIMLANLHSRFASRIMIEIAHGGYCNEEDIYTIARNINWSEWFNVDATIKVSTNAINSPLKSLEFITLRVKDAICDNFMHQQNRRPDVDKRDPDIRVYNFLTSDTVTVYLDTSGEALFKRGYRSTHQEAPLKENLAAGLIKLSGWSATSTPPPPLLDPMCGSGTIIIEALLMALNIAPGLYRKFAFEKFNNFYQNAWDNMKFAAKQAIRKDPNLKIYANDINPKAIIQATQNLQHAKLREYVEFTNLDFLDVQCPLHSSGGTIITNPPYGVRLNELDELASLYPKIASHLKNNFAGWNCYFFTADLRLPKLFRLKPSRKIPLFNGALDCRFYEFKMVSGSNR